MTKMKSSRSNRKVNVAVVGLGFMGVTHIKTYQQLKTARIVAVCDAVRLPVNGILAGVAGNITGSGALDLGRSVKVYRELADVLASCFGLELDGNEAGLVWARIVSAPTSTMVHSGRLCEKMATGSCSPTPSATSARATAVTRSPKPAHDTSRHPPAVQFQHGVTAVLKNERLSAARDDPQLPERKSR